DIIFGATNKDLCRSFEKLMKDKFQMSSMGEITFFLGLHVKQKKDGIFISQDKYVAEILKKFGLTEGKLASTPIDTEKPLLKDPDGEDVDVHTYRSMISSLMYLTSSRPDIMFAVCASSLGKRPGKAFCYTGFIDQSPVHVKPSRSLEPPPTECHEDSNYGRQPMDQKTGYTSTRRRLQLRIESYQTQLNLTKPQWDATSFEYKHDFTVIDSPRAVIFRDRYGVQMMMHFNEIHKFSDGTLQQIDEALDYRDKEFRINRMNPGLNMRFWTRKDVDRCKAFMFAIQRRLRTRRIFHNLESFVGGCVREGDYRLLKRTK
nr:hypothetical protein [Tanacetum cinerariifolium]